MRAAFEGSVAGHRVALLHDGAQCFPAMLEAIERAREEVCLEMYWFASDRTGRRFAEALRAKAADGVRVRILYDAAGSWGAAPELFEGLARAGCEVQEFHPIAPWRRRFRLDRVGRRDHRKILVVDGAAAFTGGVNLADEWAPVDEGGQGWRDDLIYVEGPAAADLRAVFFHTWRSLERSAGRSPRSRPELRSVGPVQVLVNFGYGQRRAIRRAYLRRIAASARYVHLSNSYFIPDARIRAALARAAARGVKVRVLVPGRSDIPAAYWAGRYLYGRLLRAGVELYEWQPTILHTKTAVLDDVWSTIGTYNLDHRSWRLNREVNVACEDASVARALNAQFERDLASAARVDPTGWAYRPLYARLLERFFYAFRRLL